MQRKLLLYLFLACLLILASCSFLTNSALRNKIEGKGKIQIDPENPWLAPNRFLSEEAGSSEALKGFLDLKGSPQHISYKEPFLSSPRLMLYYDTRNEMYILEYLKKEWIISGPLPIENDEEQSSEKSSSLFPPADSPLINFENTSQKTASDVSANTSASSDRSSSTNTTAKTIAEPRFEDVFHLVRFKGESIEFIAHWYTKDIANTSRIKNINEIPKGILPAGTTVRIPSYLLKRKEAPSEEDLKKFIDLYN